MPKFYLKKLFRYFIPTTIELRNPHFQSAPINSPQLISIEMHNTINYFLSQFYLQNKNKIIETRKYEIKKNDFLSLTA